MLLFLFLLGFIIYSTGAWISYSDTIKQSFWYYPLGLTLSVIANYAWLTIAKITPNKDDILLYGSIWDSIILGTFIIIPFMFFDLKLGYKDAIGFSLIILGILIVKFFKF